MHRDQTYTLVMHTIWHQNDGTGHIGTGAPLKLGFDTQHYSSNAVGQFNDNE